MSDRIAGVGGLALLRQTLSSTIVPARPLFVTRKYPPSIGGMQTLAAGVWRAMSSASSEAVLLAYGGSNRGLPRWLPFAVLRTASLLARRKIDLVLCGDALMYAVLTPILRAFRVRHAAMVMGLDLTYGNRIYRAVVHPLLRRAPAVLAISEATAEAARELGIPADRVSVVRLGVQTPDASPDRRTARRLVGELIGVGEDAVVLLTLGRLVRRKGARWFVGEVMPRLPAKVVYVLAGDGDELEPVQRAAVRAGTADRVYLLGQVDDEEREVLMRGADLFVQPNIRVPGDMEGFGLVTVEAAMRGVPVVAAALEGILDAVVDGQTGVLLSPGDADVWVTQLGAMVADRPSLEAAGARAASECRARYSEDGMRAAFVDLLRLPQPGRSWPVTDPT